MLDKKTRQRIITDAETHTNEFEAQILGKPDTSNKESYLNGREDGYIAGASAEAERAQGLVEALEKIVDLAIKMGEDATEIWAIADGALTKHADYKNNSK